MNRTVEKKGISSITIRTTGHEKSSFTVVLACTASGRKLPPMMIFKRKTVIKEKLPSGVIVHNNEKGWMDNNVMDLWLKRCYVQMTRWLLPSTKKFAGVRLHEGIYQRHL